MHRRILVLAALTVAIILAVVVYAKRPQRITEDDPRWDCRTMGNKICGPSPSPTPAKQVYLCAGITKTGARCKRHVKKQGDYCWQHKSQAK